MKHILTFNSQKLTHSETINYISSTFYNTTGFNISINFRSYHGVARHVEILSDVCDTYNPFNKLNFVNDNFTLKFKTIQLYFCPIRGINLKFNLIDKPNFSQTQ